MSTDQIATPLGPYSHAKVGGGLIYCAGQLALDPATSEPLTHLSAKEQTTVVLDNLRTVLDGFGATFDDVLRTTVYLARLDDYASMNEAYRAAFGQLRPARATIEVSALLGGLAVEIDAVAVAPKHGHNA
ncbi:RidA family protein [Mycolicibacterium wolinskyi]|uniref:RidA family protein n=1 Tax=Mycolicibacterium wolinskyi TaxID=59750 RepID=UPI00391792C7